MDTEHGLAFARSLGVVAGSLTVILVSGCAGPEGAYRNAYGAGLADWTLERGVSADRGIGSLESARNAKDPAESRLSIRNIGRPEPPPPEIPGIFDIPEIPDEPTVLPE